MTTPSYVGRLTRSEAGGAATTSIQVSNWGALEAGDLLLVFAASWGPGLNATCSGYTLLGSVQNASGGNPSAYVWGKIIGDPASEPNIVIAWNSSAGYTRSVVVQARRGGDAAIILDGAVTTSYGTGSLATPETSTTLDGALVIHFVVEASTPTITGTAPFNVADDTQVAGGSGSQQSFSIIKSPAGATGQALAALGGGLRGVGILVPLRPGQPRGSASTGATLAAAQDATAADIGDATAAATLGATQGWTYTPGPNEADGTADATAGAVQDAVQGDAGTSSAAAHPATTADAVQAEAGGNTAGATAGATADARQDEAGAGTAAATLGATGEAGYLPPGVVYYPDADTWGVVIDGIGAAQVTVRITDNQGSTILLHLNQDGIVPEPDNILSQLGTVSDAGYWEPGEATAAAHQAVTGDATQAEVASASAATTLGAQADAEALAPLGARWLAKAFKLGMSWVGGPYRRIPQDQFAWTEEAFTAAASQDTYFTEKDSHDEVGAATGQSVAQDATWTISEPKDIAQVAAIPLNLCVPAIPRNTRARLVARRAAVAEAIPLNVCVAAIPRNIRVPVEARR